MLNVDLKRIVKDIELYLLQSAEFKAVTVEVMDDDEEYVIIDIPSHGLYIEVRREEVEVGIAKRLVTQLTYAPGYYHVVSGSYWEPDEPVEKEINQCSTLLDACVDLASLMFRQRLENFAEAESLASEIEFTRGYEIEQVGTSILEEAV